MARLQLLGKLEVFLGMQRFPLMMVIRASTTAAIIASWLLMFSLLLL